LGLNSDSENFSVIKERLLNKKPVSEYDFVRQAIYVILAGGFSQKTAKKVNVIFFIVFGLIGDDGAKSHVQ
jgi:hypothetical protein